MSNEAGASPQPPRPQRKCAVDALMARTVAALADEKSLARELGRHRTLWEYWTNLAADAAEAGYTVLARKAAAKRRRHGAIVAVLEVRWSKARAMSILLRQRLRLATQQRENQGRRWFRPLRRRRLADYSLRWDVGLAQATDAPNRIFRNGQRTDDPNKDMLSRH